MKFDPSMMVTEFLMVWIEMHECHLRSGFGNEHGSIIIHYPCIVSPLESSCTVAQLVKRHQQFLWMARYPGLCPSRNAEIWTVLKIGTE